MAAPLGRHLVLDVQGRHAGRLVRLHGAAHAERVAVAGVGVGDERDADGRSEVAGVIGHLGEAGVAEIRQAQARGRRAEARHVDGREPGALDQADRHAVVGARHNQAVLLANQAAQRTPWAHAEVLLARAMRRSSAGCE
jgi:hypothetical protein